MARKQIVINTVSYIYVNGERVRFDALPDDVKRYAATCLKARYMNELFRGRAVFSPAEDAERRMQC